MPHFADQMQSCVAEVLLHELIAQQTMRLRLAVPAELAQALPGQFFMLRDHRNTDPLIGRAFALYDSDPSEQWIEVVYVIKGKFTSSIASLIPGQSLSIWGPLGNCFDDSPTEHLIIVAGGIGQTPFLALAKEATGLRRYGNRRAGYANRVSFCYGVRSSSYLADISAFKQTGASVLIATDDGTHGQPQLVTHLLERLLEDDSLSANARIVCCGPEPMMKAVTEIAMCRGIDCQVSLETPMACGIGICFSCVARVGTPTEWDYQRTCVEGPIFDAKAIVW